MDFLLIRQEYVREAGLKALINQVFGTSDGIAFDHLEKLSYRYFAAKVGDVVLDVLVEIDPERPSNGKGSAHSHRSFEMHRVKRY